MNENESIKFLKNQVKYMKNLIERMKEDEILNSIRLAEAEKNWLVLKKDKGEKIIDDQNFTEKLNDTQIYKEKFQRVQKEVILLIYHILSKLFQFSISCR